MKHYGKAAVLAGMMMALTACQSAGHSSASNSDDPDSDRCSASQYQDYVGKPLESVTKLQFDHPVRAISWNSAVTMDFNLNRLNFLADQNGNISKVYCG